MAVRSRLSRIPGPLLVLGLAVVAGAVRLPFLATPLGSDESGFLTVAAQWSPGTSLYGDYWVDRPPLLIAVFAAADGLGGAVALRVIGVALVIASVLLAGRIGVLLGPRPPGVDGRLRSAGGVPAALAAAVFLSNPMFGVLAVDGELVAVPVVLAGILATLAALRSGSLRARSWWLLGAGAAAAAAPLVKQNEIDVAVFAVAALGAAAVASRRTGRPTRLVADLATATGGAVALTVLVLLGAAWRGTSPAGLWDAVVTFRVAALDVVHQSASGATDHRLWRLLGALALSGAPVVVLLLVARLRRRRPFLAWPALALLAWEAVSLMAGGSFWLHYLVVLVPGLVVAVGVVAAERPGPARTRLLTLSPVPVLAGCALVTAVALGVVVGRLPVPEPPVSTWLSQHARPGDTAVVAYGHSDLTRPAGLTSPYSELWSLPVRVRDPRLSELSALLAGPRRPTWVVTGPHGLASWGIDATRADVQLASRYRLVARVDDHLLYLDRTTSRT